MRYSRAMVLAAVGLLLASPMMAQIPRGAVTTRVNNAPRLMVANPYAFASGDSLAAVQVGSAMRQRIDKIGGRNFQVIKREQMNDALATFGYPPDAILSPVVQRRFAGTISARTYVSSTLARTSGATRLTTRLAGLNDDAGRTVVVSGATANPQSLGEQAANALNPALDAMSDAKECIDNSATKPDKASDAAKKALKTDPENGLAWYCLTQMAIKNNASGDSVIALLQKTVEGDELSLKAWTLLAARFDAKGDTAKVVEAYQKMIQVAPTNEELRKQAFQYFIQTGRTDAARAAVEEAIEADPYNPDNYDLLSNVCIFESNYGCAVDALEQAYQIDSTKVDSTFYMKITVTAAQQPDTLRLLKWARAGAAKFPQNVDLNSQLLTAYSLTGELDSVLVVTQRVLQMDTTTVAPALAAAQNLATAKRVKEALPLFEIVGQRGTPQDKENAAIILVNGALPLLQEPQDLEGAAMLAREALKLADPAGRVYPNANYVLGLATVIQVSKMDPETEKAKSCDMARQEQSLVNESLDALTKGRAVKPDLVDQYLGYLRSLVKRTDSMVKAYCK